MEEPEDQKDIELQPIITRQESPGRRPLVLPLKPKKTVRSTFCITITIFISLLVTAVSVWGLSRSYNISSLNHADIANAAWLKILANWKPIADDVLATMDTTADVCTDPWQWACGGWLAKNTIPAGSAFISKAQTTVRENHNLILASVIKEKWPIVSPYYTSCNESWHSMEFNNIADIYEAIENVTDKTELFALLGSVRSTHGLRLANFAFRIGVETDPFNSSSTVVVVHAADNTLPSPLYYSADSEVDLQSYRRFIASMFAVTPRPINTDEATAIYNFESSIATIISSLESASYEITFARHSLQETQNIIGGKISAWLSEFSLLTPEHTANGMFVITPNYFTDLNYLVDNTTLATLKNLALYSLFRHTYPLLGPLYFNTHRELSGLLSGIAVHSYSTHERENFCIRTTVNNMPMLMGHYYVVSAGIDETYKQHVKDIVQITKEAFSTRLETTSWMDTFTKNSAEKKLEEMTQQVCYPDNWESVLTFEQALGKVLDPMDFFANTLLIYKTNDKIEFDAVLKLSSASDWSFDFIRYNTEGPEIINAFYSPSKNRIIIAAGMAQAPYIYSYDWRKAPLPSTFGGIVTVVGHEITHGFDNEGSQFNSKGNLENWWSDASKRQFSIDAQCIAESRSRVETQIKGQYLNGNLVLGESIADLGGIETALDAMDMWETLKLSKEDRQLYDSALYEIFPTFNREQLFFLFFMQNYCELQTDESVYEQVVTDPHPPGKQRVEALLPDVPRFAKAFNCKKNTKFNPPDRCSIWGSDDIAD